MINLTSDQRYALDAFYNALRIAEIANVGLTMHHVEARHVWGFIEALLKERKVLVEANEALAAERCCLLDALAALML